MIEEVLRYDPQTGHLWWITTQQYSQSLSKPAGSLHKNSGYVIVGYKRKYYRAHRVAWYLTYYYWPKELDHINGNRSDNRLSNLREVTRSENLENQQNKSHGKSHSGLRGVHKHGNNWRSKINVNNIKINLGTFKTIQEAHQAYLAAKQKYHKYNERI